MMIFVIFIACSKGKDDMKNHKASYKILTEVPNEDWNKLNGKRIYFGHQSVGFNIVDGIRDVMKNNPQIKINIIETSDLSTVNRGCFAHSLVGENVIPESKINEFEKFIENGIGNTADISGFKFCFVDIHTGTDIDKLFNLYKERMDYLSNKYPKLRIIHMTVPLTSNPVGIKGMIKKVKDILKLIMGKDNMYENKIKFEYNEKIRKAYGNTGRLFDLALSESTYKNGKQYYVKSGNKNIQSLIPEYTDDGGHLNYEGRYKVAEDFLLFLVNQ